VRRDQDLVRQFGRDLREAREEGGMSEADLVSATGLTVSEVSHLGARPTRAATDHAAPSDPRLGHYGWGVSDRTVASRGMTD
jgi:hypothetical protein